MWRALNLLLVLAVLGGAGIVYGVKYHADLAKDEAARLEREIVNAHREIGALRAEWSALDQPERLQALAEKYNPYLELEPVEPLQVGRITDIPFRSRPIVAPDITAGADAGPNVTGSIAPDDRPAPRSIAPRPNDPLLELIGRSGPVVEGR